LRKLVRIPAAVPGSQWARAAILLGLVWQIVPPAALPTEAASATTATLTGGSGTQVASGSLYAKKGAPLTLVVNTTCDTFCVKLSGDQTGQLNTNAASVGKTTWTFNNLKATAGTPVTGDYLSLGFWCLLVSYARARHGPGRRRGQAAAPADG